MLHMNGILLHVAGLLKEFLGIERNPRGEGVFVVLSIASHSVERERFNFVPTTVVSCFCSLPEFDEFACYWITYYIYNTAGV